MQGQLPNRKRPAPGASPLQQQSTPPMFNSNNFSAYPDTSANSGDQFMDWNTVEGLNGAGNPYDSGSNFDANYYNNALNNMANTQNTAAASSNQLVRRNTNQQIAARSKPAGGNLWQDLDNTGQVSEWPTTTVENDEELEKRAMAAKKEAQSKRKQIPPFVQKLSSFLDESKNTDLIRWSDDGNSFIVLDEDEFAKTLIPELFKHNNYASFVRQLNMYGFHKRVGLSDNSMKASENKRKTPSEYYNEFFKRGRPELLWLIQKPKNTPSTGKRKKGEKGEGDSDEETKRLLPETDRTPTAQPMDAANTRQDLITLPKTELNAVRQELRQLQNQQKFISSVIAQIKRQNDQLYQQASAFQTLHDRHENSINAILTFLATFYNRSLEGHSGTNLADMFAHAIPENMQQHGNVVDVGDMDDVNPRPQNQPPRPNRRPLALLPAPDGKDAASHLSGGRATTVTPSPASETPPRKGAIFRPPNQVQFSRNRPSSAQASSNNTASPMIKTDADSPNFLDHLQDVNAASSNTPNTEQMMSVINAANNASGNTPTSGSFDFPAALSNYQTANGAAPLTPQQKNDALSLIASKIGNTNANANNALVNSNVPNVPDLNQSLAENQNKLDYLQQLQHDNERRVQNLAERLTPLSPTGTIPGLDMDGNSTLGPQMGAPGGSLPPEWDLNSFVNTDDYFPNMSAAPAAGDVHATGNPDMDLFDFGGYDADTVNPGNNGLSGDFDDDDLFGDSSLNVPNANLNVDGGGKVESVASSGPTSGPASPADMGLKSNIGEASPKKRRRVG
ncbi:hypothetical protein NA57DRAFT_80962 [Rhizodiscina lignyota]|uniref:HSF-type DNA-binding domain-containing protein n=1 Tax=Rhizodiscina lignyota TaxID=1504668 RepID=A0A9P4M459_9PEZI|nr:hypothetical protein NA57DRAFT_80962 [Rhizodiscina lignyota]